MNEQEKAFMAFVEWLPKNIEKFVNAKPEDIISYLEELGKTPEGQNELKSLITKYKQSKNAVTLNKKGGKVETFIKKFNNGGPYRDTVEVHNKWRVTPLWMSIAAADGVDVPKKHYTHDPRQFKYIKSPNGQRWGIIQNKVNGRSTIFELDNNNEPISSEYGGQKYEYGDDMFNRHVNNYKFYTDDIFIPSDKKGGKIDYLVNKFANGGPYSWVPKGDFSVETPEGIVTYKTTNNEIVNMQLKMHDGRTVGAVIRNGQFVPVILPNLRNTNEAIPLTGKEGQEVSKMMETLYNSHVIPHEKQRYLYEYYPSYSIEGPRDSRIQTIVQNDYPHSSITRVNDNGNYIYQGDSFGPTSILNQDSLANVWNTLYESPRTKKNK